MDNFFKMRHRLREHDFEVLKKLELKFSPVGFKVFTTTPKIEPLEKLDKKIAWCQMLSEAQKGHAFYAESDNHFCEPGLFLLGHEQCAPLIQGGIIGPIFNIYPDERANRRVYNSLHYLPKGSVHCTAFSPLEKLNFEPDLLIITCDSISQTERLLRACQYDTGDVIESRMTYVIGCNWIYTYPFMTGKINYITTGLGHGLKRYQAHPDGSHIVTIPWDHIDRVLRNMREMPWSCPAHTEHSARFYDEARIKLESINVEWTPGGTSA